MYRRAELLEKAGKDLYTVVIDGCGVFLWWWFCLVEKIFYIKKRRPQEDLPGAWADLYTDEGMVERT